MKLKAQIKPQTGKGMNRRLRRDGQIPAILYGKHQSPIPLSLDQLDTEKVINAGGARKILELSISGLTDNADDTMVMFKDVQRNPLTGKLVHIDLYSVRQDEEISMTIPIHFVGETKDIDKEGTLQFVSREISIQCLPKNIPGAIEVDISGMKMGHSMTVSDLKLPEKVKLLDDPGKVIASIVAVRAAAVEQPEAEEETAEAAPTETD
ncbi:50S ribosomal protein L25 [bacterium]|nr:50S ribosomal protein L25 [candidate division CSSED10-310 bacterium]